MLIYLASIIVVLLFTYNYLSSFTKLFYGLYYNANLSNYLILVLLTFFIYLLIFYMKSLFLPFTGHVDGQVFCIPSTIYLYCLILVIPIIISIVLLSLSLPLKIRYLLDTDKDQERRRRSKDLNLQYKYVNTTFGYRIFVWDNYDTLGNLWICLYYYQVKVTSNTLMQATMVIFSFVKMIESMWGRWE